MAPEDYAALDATDLAQAISRGEVTAEAVLETAINRIEALNPRVNAVVETLYDRAREDVAALDMSAPFAGVPILIKDLHTLVAGSRLTHGSRFFADHVSSHDSDLVALLRRAGFIVLGRTNTPEFGLNLTTEPELHGATRNPWNLDYSTGGSSGGSAAAVASAMVPIAHATDSGGSIRVPASACGVVGLKPSRGRVFVGLDEGEGWHDMFHAHVHTRSVRDSAAVLALTANVGRPAPWFAPFSGQDFSDRKTLPKPLNIGVLATPPSGVPVDRACTGALEDAAELCTDLGHRTRPIALAFDGRRFAEAFTLAISASVAATVGYEEARTGRTAGPEDFEAVVWNAVELGRSASASELNAAMADLHLIGRHIMLQMQDVDLILTPTLASPPKPLGSFDTAVTDFGAFLAKIFAFGPFTSMFNVTGQPAISLPLSFDRSSGLPIGIQVVGHQGRDAIVLGFAEALEAARPWSDRYPSFAGEGFDR